MGWEILDGTPEVAGLVDTGGRLRESVPSHWPRLAVQAHHPCLRRKWRQENEEFRASLAQSEFKTSLCYLA